MIKETIFHQEQS